MPQSNEPNVNDRSQVGLPESTDDLLKELCRDTRWFKGEADVYRLAVSLALARELHPRSEESDGGYTTKFSVQTLDPDGQLALLIATLHPDYAGTPYRWAQRLANKGVCYLHSELLRKGRPIAEVLLGAEED
jgi:hypothetical protein